MHYKKIVPGVLSVLAVWVLSMQITNAVYEEELAEAVNNGDLQAVTNYISKGADVNARSIEGRRVPTRYRDGRGENRFNECCIPWFYRNS